MPPRRLPAASWALAVLLLGTAPSVTATAAPERLSQTGLYSDPAAAIVAPGHRSYSPQYPLWTDGARKRRWISLPPGSHIDARNPDAWEFPRGTRLWKEFAFEQNVETRMIERLPDGRWRYVSYIWDERGTDAWLAPVDGAKLRPAGAAPGSTYRVPSQGDCRVCHEGPPTPVLGFSALQLSEERDPLAPHGEAHGAAGTTLRELVRAGVLRNLPAALLDRAPVIPARSALERAALGYLHGNCGHCHRAADTAVPVDAVFALDALGTDGPMTVLRSLLGGRSRFRHSAETPPLRRIEPGSADHSLMYLRMASRDARQQMPPLGTAQVDTNALQLIRRWIEQDLPQHNEVPP